MTPQEAVERLHAAGLHARLMDCGQIIGGSYVDRSGGCNMVHGSYLISPEGEHYTVRGYVSATPMTLDEAVALVIHKVPPGKDIPPTPRSGDGPVYY